MKTVLVTGSSGFLGTRFMQRLIADPRDLDIWAVDLLPSRIGLPTDCADLGEWLEDFEEDIDLVIHMAAPVGGREKIEGDPLYNADSLRLDSLLFRWSVKHAKTVLYPSSSAVYGTALQGGDGVALIESDFRPGDRNWFAPDEMYGFTKMAGEMLAYKAAKYGLNTLCVRPFSGYGPGQSLEYPVPSIARRVISRDDPVDVWGPGTQTRDFIHVDDVVDASISRLAAGVDGYQAMNIGTGVETSFNRVAELMAEISGYWPQINNVADRPVGVTRRYCDPTEMLKYHTPSVSIRDGLEDVLDWMRRND